MKPEPITYACCSDISGKLRGKGFPAADFKKRLLKGVGWTPTNVQITCFDTIAPSPFGSLGDLLLVPDAATRTQLDFGNDQAVEDFVLANVRHLDGQSWACCTRAIVQTALDRLEAAAGLTLFGTFEHEFTLHGTKPGKGLAFTLGGFRRERVFAETLMASLRSANITPDTFIREFGPDQFEITITPTEGISIADQGAILREVVQIVAEKFERRASFTPLPIARGIGNGVHIHMSFRDKSGNPATYDPSVSSGMSAATGAFIAGVLQHLPSIIAFTAPSVISYQRLVPHRWSAAFNNLGAQDREAAVRLCPVSKMNDADPATQFNFEFRAADATASPHLQLAAIVHAGAWGIEQNLATPIASAEDLSNLDSQELSDRGIDRLPTSLGKALDNLASDDIVRSWFPDGFVEVYLAHKRDEIRQLAEMDEDEQCAAYAEVY